MTWECNVYHCVIKEETYNRVMSYVGKDGITNEKNFDKVLNELLDDLDAELSAR